MLLELVSLIAVELLDSVDELSELSVYSSEVDEPLVVKPSVELEEVV